MSGIDQSRDTGGLAHYQCSHEVEVSSAWASSQMSTREVSSRGLYVHRPRNTWRLAAVNPDSELDANSYGSDAGSA